MRHFPTLEIDLAMARETWPRRFKSFAGDGWRIEETMTDIAFARGASACSIGAIKAVYTQDAAWLNKEYGKGRILYRSNSIEQDELINLVDDYHMVNSPA